MGWFWLLVGAVAAAYAIVGIVRVPWVVTRDEMQLSGRSWPVAFWHVYTDGFWEMAQEPFGSRFPGILLGMLIALAAFVLIHTVLWPFVLQDSVRMPKGVDPDH